ncbi:MAG: M48 family metalloprotease, partial [Phycisphaerae bacterium]|nr:M48 family metalloprotease [Phycisphaerae bacterium]
MHVVVLLGFMVALAVPPQIPLAEVTGWQLAAALLGYLVITALLGLADAGASLKGLGGETSVPSRILHRHHRMAVISQAWLVAGMAVLASLGWSWWVNVRLDIARWPLVGDLLAAGPFLLALPLMWLMQYPVHRAVRLRMAAAMAERGERPVACWSLREYMGFNLRHQLLFIAVPISLILFGVECLDLLLIPADYRPGSDPALEAVYAAGSLAVAGLVFLAAPLLLIRIWKTHPLPPSPLRDQLEQTCDRMGVGHRDILVWESGGVLVNAAAMGLIARVRYALLSDALLEQMDREHVRAVFAHEVAHARMHHILFAALFAMAAATCSSAAGVALAAWLGLEPWMQQTLTVVLLAGSWVFGFGFVSRRFERQSDVIGAWASGPGGPPDDPAETRITPAGAIVFAQALQRVADLNGVPLSQRNWRHGKMVDRVAHIQMLGMTGGTREGIDRSVRRIKLALTAAFLLGVSVIVLQIS